MLGAGLGIPAKSIPANEAAAHFGWLAAFVGLDLSASSAWTRKALDWKPSGPKLLQDLQWMDFSV